MPKSLFRTAAALILASTALTVAVANLHASSGGRTGVSQSSTGCSCHSTIPNQNGAATVSISGPQNVAPGGSASYTVSVSGGPNGTTGGFNLKATGGTFTAGGNNKISNGEMTHSSNASRSWTFTWTAPVTEGVVNFYAIAQATNGSGTDGDSWNWYGGAVNTPFAITVANTGVGDGARAGLWLAAPSPNPVRSATLLAYSLATDGPVRLEILDVTGRRVTRLADGFQLAGRHEVRWMGRSDAGAPLASGVYFARLVASGTTLRSRIQLMH